MDTKTNYKEQIEEAFQHLENGRYKIALINAQKVYDEYSEDPDAIHCYALALLENGRPGESLELENYSVQLYPSNKKVHLNRAYILMRLGIYEGAINDISIVEGDEKLRVEALILKAKILAGTEKYEEALSCLSNINNNKKAKELIHKLDKIISFNTSKFKKNNLVFEAEEALNTKDFWFSLWASNKLQSNSIINEDKYKAMLIEIKSLIGLFQLKQAFEKALLVKSLFVDNEEFCEIYLRLEKHFSKKKVLEKTEEVIFIPEIKKDIFEEIDKLIGLNQVKQSLKDFVDYLKFIKDRKDFGIKTKEEISFHCVFLGNPGTGKTTVARLLGQIFKELNILSIGHVVEVDRAALVGQYIGETAQKTERIVNDSMGGILFVDEAYSLKKENSGQDFGQEAIDIILKRMEDAQGQFVVIAAGYPEEMKFFINSNPGLKSRFTHFFNFEDYNPDELIEIFKVFASSEEFSIEPDATEILKNYFNDAYKKRDESFGNARLVRKLFNEVKILLGKRYLKEKNKEVLTTINVDDIEALLKKRGYKKHDKNLNEEKLEILLKEINSIAGISLVKKDIVKLVDSLKLSRLREERGLSVIKRNLNSIFVGNKGTGKTIIAAKLGLIFKELGVLNNGHLIEVDKTSLHSINTIDELLKNAEGGILLIKEVDKIVKENLKVFDKLIKRLEEQNFDVIVILTGTNNGITEILENIPSLKNIFMKQFYFQDLNPRELLESTLSLTEKAGYKLDEGAWQMLHDIFNSESQNKKTGFTNSDLVKNFLFKALNNQEERILKINNPDNEQLCTITLEDIEKINYNF